MRDHPYATESTDLQKLLAEGFSETEAVQLIHMKDHVSEQVEYREMLQESRRLDFIRWLIEHDRISH
jgi:rRNA processing protein Krr1/Pno1